MNASNDLAPTGVPVSAADSTDDRRPCKGCGATITRATVQAQARRLRRLGFSEEMIDYAMPRCGPCVRRWQRESAFGRIWTMACRGMAAKRKAAAGDVPGGVATDDEGARP